MMELMLTIGILAVALVMVSALFPIDVKQSNESYKNVVGTLICQNGLAVAKTMVTGTNRPSGATLSILADENNTGIISKKSQHYQEFEDTDYEGGTPVITDSTYKLQGFLVLGRKIDDSNQLVIVSYARSYNNAVTAEPISCDVNGDKIANGGGYLIVGSPLIDRNTGYYATIIETNGTKGTLDRPIDPSVTGSISAYVIKETNATKSPALSVLVTLTGLE